MANVKLKSIFTKEDIYTVLQLLKALADGVDENDADMQAQIDALKTKIDTLKPEPEGYAVDDAGNVTIAGALKANNNGNVEVLKNLNVDGNASVNTLPFRAQDIALAQLPVKDLAMGGGDAGMKLPAILIHCHSAGSIEGMGVTASGVYAIVRATITVDADSSTTINVPFSTVYVYNDQMQPVTTLDEALEHGHLETSTLMGFAPVTFDEDMKTFHIDGGEITEAKIQKLTTSLEQGSHIDYSVTVGYDGLGNSLGYMLDLKSGAKYQHTITIKFDNANKNILTFTAMCDNSLSISSLQDLSIYFGGCRLTCSGGDDTGDRYVYLDTHPSNPNDYVVGYVNSTGFHTDETIGTLTGAGMTITDDVCVPK